MTTNSSAGEAFATHIVSLLENDRIPYIARQACELRDESEMTRYESAVASGVSLGAEIAFDLIGAEVSRLGAMLTTTLNNIDDEITKNDDTDTLMMLADLRRPIAEFFAGEQKKILRGVAIRLEQETCVPRDIVSSSTPITDIERDTIIAIGMKGGMTDPDALAGFRLWGDDETMECKCPFHLAQRFKESGISADEMLQRFPASVETVTKAFHDYGMFLTKSARERYAEASAQIVERGYAVTSMSPAEAKKTADAVIARMTGSESK